MANRQFDQSRVPVVRKFLIRRRRKPVVRSVAEHDMPTATMPQPPIDATESVNINAPAQPRRSRNRDWGWSLIWLSFLLVLGGTAAGAFFWLITMPPPIDCKNISPLSPDMERLQCAQQAAVSRDIKELKNSIDLVRDWPLEDPLYPQASQLRDKWSRALLEHARNKMEEGDLKSAVDLAKYIPANSSVSEDAQALLGTWQEDWDQGKEIYAKAVEALKKQQWDQVTAYAQQLAQLRNEHWSQQRMKVLLEELAAEKLAWNQLKQARAAVQYYQTPDTLEKAITLAGKIESQRYVHAQAKTDIRNWSRQLLDLAAKQLEKRDLEGTLAIAKRVPTNSELYPEAQDFIQISRAQLLVPDSKSGSQQQWQQILAVMEAQAAASQIKRDRPLYQQAQAKITDWQAQLQDLIQLQVASSLSTTGQGMAFQIAIEQAKQIASNRPRRIHAQTLIAQWRKELKEAEDRPFIVLAKQLAERKTIESYQAAITQARQVALGRPLRLEAQTYIASWTKQIQTIEDQPILDEANTLAKKGNLGKAISVAEKIAQGRALHKQAQSLIGEWSAQIQIAEDQPKLNEAARLAAQGRLSEAISVASQIGYGRALYYEAQDGIARWTAERNAIQASRQAPAPEPYYPPAESSAPAYSAPAQTYSTPAQTYSAPAPEPYNPPPAQTYNPPAPEPEPYIPPAQTYNPPAPEPYYPPAETYTAPEPEPYTPPAQTYTPPQETYVPPAEPYYPPEPAPAAPPPEEAPAAAPLPIDGIE
jgi:hypothetical protein